MKKFIFITSLIIILIIILTPLLYKIYAYNNIEKTFIEKIEITTFEHNNHNYIIFKNYAFDLNSVVHDPDCKCKHNK